MRVSTLTDHFGVELHGFPTAQAPTDDALRTLQDAFDAGVFAIRGQTLTEEEHDDLIMSLGELHMYPWGTTVEYMSNVIPGPGISGTRELLFHVDGVYGEHVAPGTSLYALEVSPTSAPTVFANSVRAYELLSDDVKKTIDNLHGFNTFNDADAETDADPSRYRIADHPEGMELPSVKRAVHPMVITLPHTGERAIFVNEFNTSHIMELGPDSQHCEDLLQEIFAVLYAEDNLYTHKYENGDLIVWNNFAVQHARPARLDSAPRSFRRLVLTSLNW